MAKHLMFIHGRSFKPNKKPLEENWLGAIEHGLERDKHEKAPDIYKSLQDAKNS